MRGDNRDRRNKRDEIGGVIGENGAGKRNGRERMQREERCGERGDN